MTPSIAIQPLAEIEGRASIEAKLPINPSESVRKLNPHLYRVRAVEASQSKPPKRIRQSSAPLMNKLETEWFNIVSGHYPNFPRPRAQSKRYRLGNGIWFKPDVTVSLWPCDGNWSRETAWEVKGPHAFRGGFENLKVAAALYPEIQWILAWKMDGKWRQQIVLP